MRSPHARARILDIRWHPDRAPAGAVCVTARDLQGPNSIRLVDDSWPILASGEVRHVGEPVALVAARTREDARLALDGVELVYEPLEPVLSLDDAASPALHAGAMAMGDVERAFAEASSGAEEFSGWTIVTGEYHTGLQEHLYIECQGMTARWDDNARVMLNGTMQCPYYVHAALMHAFGLAGDHVRVRASAVGGGFGGKEDYPSMIAVHAALLSRAAGAPVRIVYDRHEDLIGTTKRHPSLVRHRTLVDRDGRLQAMDIEIVLDGGAYLTLSSVVLSRAMLHATGPYRCPNVRIRGVVRRTNTPANGAFRGFGAPQVAFAVERQMDRIARRLGLDPYTIRDRNVLVEGDRLATGQVMDHDCAARECLEAVVTRTGFRKRWLAQETSRGTAGSRAGGRPRHGVGLSLSFHGAGFTGNGERRMRSPVTARLLADGRIEVAAIATDIGQGATTVLLQIAADAAGVTLDDVTLTAPDTSLAPDSGPTVASRTTMVVGQTMAQAVTEVRDRLLQWWHSRTDESIPRGSVTFREMAQRYVSEVGTIEITRHHEPPAWQTFDETTYTGAAYVAYSWGADVVEVEVDPDTFETRTERATVVCEVGTPVHPGLCVGQVEGGTLQAIGYGLMEEIKVERGRYLNDRMATYIIPTCKDSPVMDVQLLRRAAVQEGTVHAKGVGELPIDGGAPALAAAIENATGLFPAEIPVTPERLFELQREAR